MAWRIKKVDFSPFLVIGIYIKKKESIGIEPFSMIGHREDYLYSILEEN